MEREEELQGLRLQPVGEAIGSYDPRDGQWSQLIAPVPSANWPASQFLHDPPVASWYRPISQSEQIVAVATAYLPLGQAVHDAAL